MAGVAAVKVSLGGLGTHGNPSFAVDFRDLYATVLERRWGADSARGLNDRFSPVGLVRS